MLDETADTITQIKTGISTGLSFFLSTKNGTMLKVCVSLKTIFHESVKLGNYIKLGSFIQSFKFYMLKWEEFKPYPQMLVT